MIELKNLTLNMGVKTLFKDANLHIGEHARIGLVGRNGSGKTSLMKLLLGEVEKDEGLIIRANFASIGYLPQENAYLEGLPVLEETKKAFKEVTNLKELLDETHEKLAMLNPEEEEYNEVLNRMAYLEDKYSLLDGYSIEARCAQVLKGLGFKDKDFTRPSKELSGGWQMRIALAKLILEKPWLIMLDEPTNHLDFDSLLWLENFLENYKGSILVVSHDRRFLDNLIDVTYEIENEKITKYKGNYSYYEVEKEMREERLIAEKKHQADKIEEIERFIERFRYKASKAKQVQSRVKMLEKIELIKIEKNPKKIRFKFPVPPKLPLVVVNGEKLNKSYGEIEVFKDAKFIINRNDRIGLIGPNGEGKSTLSKIVCHIEKPSENSNVIWGENVFPAYFAQHQSEDLNPNMTVLECAYEINQALPIGTIRGLLGSFLFTEDDIIKQVGVLSGGEKSRLALVRVLIKNANLLVLDEPTNHLDMDSKETLVNALKKFEGTLVVTSHDRDFLAMIATKIFEVRNGKIIEYLGDIDYYTEKSQIMESLDQSSNTNKSQKRKDYKEEKRLEAEKRQEAYRQSRPVKEKIEKIEKEIIKLEEEKETIEKIMLEKDFYENSKRIQEALMRLAEINGFLGKLNMDYEKLLEEYKLVSS